jgi:hypothetical protein
MILKPIPVLSGDTLDVGYDDSAQITLSEGALRTVRIVASGNYASRTITSKTSGKVYWEAECITMINDDVWIGMAVASFPNFNERVGLFATNSWGVNRAGNSASNGFAGGGFFGASGIGARGNGTVLCLAYDFATRKFWLKIGAGQWNGNNAANDPAAGTGGQTAVAAMGGVPLYPTMTANSIGDDVRFRFQTAAMGFAIPSGFSAWN